MKTFSNMSVPDLHLTKEAYQFMLALISKEVKDDQSEKEFWSIREKQARIRQLIAAIDEQLSVAG